MTTHGLLRWQISRGILSLGCTRPPSAVCRNLIFCAGRRHARNFARLPSLQSTRVWPKLVELSVSRTLWLLCLVCFLFLCMYCIAIYPHDRRCCKLLLSHLSYHQVSQQILPHDDGVRLDCEALGGWGAKNKGAKSVYVHTCIIQTSAAGGGGDDVFYCDSWRWAVGVLKMIGTKPTPTAALSIILPLSSYEGA